MLVTEDYQKITGAKSDLLEATQTFLLLFLVSQKLECVCINFLKTRSKKEKK